MKDSTSPAMAALMMIIALLAAGCDRFEGSAARLDRAADLLDRGEYNGAMIELKNVLDESPRDTQALLLLARASLLVGNDSGANQALDNAAAAGAEARALNNLRAQAGLHAGSYQDVLHLLAKQPDVEGAATLRVQALAGLNRCQEAIPEARAVIAADGANAIPYIVIAECYGRQGDTGRALRELTNAVAAAPESAEARLALGRIQLSLNHHADAEQTFAEAARLAPGKLGVPQQAMLYSSLADLQIARNDAVALRATHARVLELAPRAVFSELVGARLLLMEGKLTEATSALRGVAIHSPDLPVVHSLLASAYLARGNLELTRQELAWLEQHAPQSRRDASAREAIRALMAAKAGSEEYGLQAANLHATLGQFDLARVAIEQVLAGAPQSLAGRMGRARLELKAGNTVRALALTDELTDDHPDDPAVSELRADVLIASGNFAAADTLLGTRFARAPSASLAVALHRLRRAGKLPDTAAPLERWLERNPHDAAVRLLLADDLQRSGANARAIVEYERLASRKPDNGALLNNLAWLYHLEGDGRALATAKRAWEASKSIPAVIDTYGWLLVEAGSIEEGARLLAQADGAAGVTQPEVRFHYAVALVRSGQKASARPLLEQLLTEHADFPSRALAVRLLATLEDGGTT
jgi:predicted Zn-dependent protease